MNIKELAKIANRLDSLGLTGEADILDKIIVSGLRKSAIDLDTFEGSGLATSEQRAEKQIIEENRRKISDEMNKTYSWFKNVVFLAIENSQWPVVVDQDYLIAPNPYSLSQTDINTVKPWNDEGTYIKEGTVISGARAPIILHRSVAGDSYDRITYPDGLVKIYNEFENDVNNLGLNVAMESFSE